MPQTRASSVASDRLPHDRLDPDALQAVIHLQRAGFTSYLVGGCVRDLLLGRAPKDFDIATEATPRQIKRLFRNCRLIGRRFRLAHLYYGGKILEVATFRGMPSEGVLGTDGTDPDEAIARTNTFGTPEQDARSRDFTINGLFYDPVAGRVLDYVRGRTDIDARRLRTIGHPDARFEEDPVRILRAVKFASRLEFELDPATQQAMGAYADRILLCPAPRVTEEILRIAESGVAASAFALMQRLGVLGAILPELAEWLASPSTDGRDRGRDLHEVLTRLDRMARTHAPLPRDFVLAALLYAPARELGGAARTPGSWSDALDRWFADANRRMQVPIRLRVGASFAIEMVQRMLEAPGVKRPKRSTAFVAQPSFPAALALLRIHHQVYEPQPQRYQRWAKQAFEAGVCRAPAPMARGGGRDADPSGG